MKLLGNLLKKVVGSVDLGDIATDLVVSAAEGEVERKVADWWKGLPIEERGRIAEEFEDLAKAMRGTAISGGKSPSAFELKEGSRRVGAAVAEVVQEIRDGVRR